MSSAAPPRRYDEAAKARVRKRYAAERRFRLAGLFAVALSGAFLAFLLFTMASKGLSGFVQYQAAVPIDFARSDVMIDPAALTGPEAQDVVANAGLEGALTQAATAAYGEEAAEIFAAHSEAEKRRIVADALAQLEHEILALERAG